MFWLGTVVSTALSNPKVLATWRNCGGKRAQEHSDQEREEFDATDSVWKASVAYTFWRTFWQVTFGNKNAQSAERSHKYFVIDRMEGIAIAVGWTGRDTMRVFYANMTSQITPNISGAKRWLTKRKHSGVL